MLVLSTDRIETLTYTYRTLFEQSERLVKISAAVFDRDDALLRETGLVIRPEGAGLYAQDAEGNIALIGVSVEETAEDGTTTSVIKLTADNIKLEGLVTANGNFKILEDGSIETNKATIITGVGEYALTISANNNEGFVLLGSENREFAKLSYSVSSFWTQQHGAPEEVTTGTGKIALNSFVEIDTPNGYYDRDYHASRTEIIAGTIEVSFIENDSQGRERKTIITGDSVTSRRVKASSFFAETTPGNYTVGADIDSITLNGVAYKVVGGIIIPA